MKKIRILGLSIGITTDDGVLVPPFISSRWKLLMEQENLEFCGVILEMTDNRVIKYLKRIINYKPTASSSFSVYLKEDDKIKIIPIKISMLYKIFGLRMNKFYSSYLANMSYKSIAKQLNEFILNFKPDLIHSHQILHNGAIALELKKMYGIKCLVTAHGDGIHTFPKKSNKVRKKTVEVLEKVDKVIFVSNRLLSIAKQLGYSGRNAEIIHNGVELNGYIPQNKDIAKKKLQLPSKKDIVGFVGLLSEIKGVDLMPYIFREVVKYNPNTTFVVIGSGPLHNMLIDKCNGLDIVMLGKLSHEEVLKWMNAFDVMILPSRQEGYPTVVVEAKKVKTPIVGSEVSREAVGTCGRIVDLNQKCGVSDFAEAIIDILKEGIRDESFERESVGFSWDDIVNKEINLYKLVLNKIGASN